MQNQLFHHNSKKLMKN